jgi:hypothetical protein
LLQHILILAGVPNNNINLGYLEHPDYIELVGLNTPFQSEQEFDYLQQASLISTRDTDHWLTNKQCHSILASGRLPMPLASLVTLVNPVPRGWLSQTSSSATLELLL